MLCYTFYVINNPLSAGFCISTLDSLFHIFHYCILPRPSDSRRVLYLIASVRNLVTMFVTVLACCHHYGKMVSAVL